MGATITFRRNSSNASFDEDAGRSVYPDPVILWTGPARIQRIARRGGDQEIGARFVIVQMYQISVPADVPEIQINDQADTIVCADDPFLLGKLLRVREVRLGSLIWSRDLICEEPTPTTR